MKTRHLILMLLNASEGRIDSKTKLQKELYFISLMLNKDLEFKAHYYGPYSTEVETALDELIGAGFVDVKREVFGIDYNRGFEFKRYNFSWTESGQELVKVLKEENPEEYKIIESFVRKLQEVGDPGYLSLSLAAKAHFILSKESKPMTRRQIRKKAKKFGWNVNDHDIDIAVDILKKLDFVKEEQ